MFSSLFSTPITTAQNFFPVTSKYEPSQFFGQLEAKDTEWLCASGMVTETQTWYTILEDGTFVMCQVIHSSTGLWYPSIQFTFKTYNPNTKEKFWRSVSLNNFAPNAVDKRSCKADKFSITYKQSAESGFAESYTINSNLSSDLQVSLVISRPTNVPGFKLGRGREGGFSYFGTDVSKPEGYVVHRFWPRTSGVGHIIQAGKAIEAKGHGMFVHAIQGMRPNLVAARWNFVHFQSEKYQGVSAIQMEFTTCLTHGKHGEKSGGVSVNLGCLVAGGKLAAISGETAWPGEAAKMGMLARSRATHLDAKLDKETSHMEPGRVKFDWAAPSMLEDAPGSLSASLDVVCGPDGLVEKVDVLGEIPSMIKSVVHMTGTKPYIYQWLKPATLHLTTPPGLLSNSDNVVVDGSVYMETTFIS